MSEGVKRKVGLIIKQARMSKGLTQKELADKMGVTKTVVTNYESGGQNLTIDTLQKVAEAMGSELLIAIK